jgi:glycosyltransferase involved in cell wall biosynthesis
MKITIIISTINRLDRLERILLNIAKQTLMPEQIILIEAGDRPLDLSFIPKPLQERVILQHAPRESLAASRDRGRRIAKGEVLIFLDDDLILPNFYIEFAVLYLKKNPTILGVGGCYREIEYFHQGGLISYEVNILVRLLMLNGYLAAIQ